MFNFQQVSKEWAPHARQKVVLSIPTSVLEVFYGGAAGGGKTDLGVIIPIVRQCLHSDRMWFQHPKFKGLITRRTIPELKKELVDRCREYYEPTGAKYNGNDRVFTWPWGAKIYLVGSEHEKDVRKFDTEQFCYIFHEELTSFTEFMYVFLMSRCRPADPDLPSCMFSASNPGNIGHGWVRKRFVEPAKEGGKIIRQYFFDKNGNYVLDESTGKRKYIDRIFIKALGSDNPHLLKNDPTYLTKLEALPQAEKAAKLYGDWWTFSGQVFDSFRRNKFPDEPENALHVIPNTVIPEWWPRVLAIDWGYKAATVCYWGAISPQGVCYIYREYYVRETDIAVWSTEIGELSRGENLRCMVLDTNAWDSRGEEKTIAIQFQENFSKAFGAPLVVEQASKGRISGKTLVQEFLRWRPKPAFKARTEKVYNQEEAESLRRLSEDAYLKYLELFTPPEIEQNIPRLQIFESCKQLIECIPLCVYDENNVEDVKEWQATSDQCGDDPYDCLRYLLKRVDRYIKESKSEFEAREKVQLVVSQFQQNQDMTSFYRKMEHLEKSGIRHKRGFVKRVPLARRIFGLRAS